MDPDVSCNKIVNLPLDRTDLICPPHLKEYVNILFHEEIESVVEKIETEDLEKTIEQTKLYCPKIFRQCPLCPYKTLSLVICLIKRFSLRMAPEM
jgi:hypothetical protein